jgi:exonuclease SbcC
MRLIKLKIKNIASLKGEHLIDFGSIQNQSSLFAITGETGAGKSSILNSIGLVLYGKVYKSNVTQNDLVTLGEKEGQIELIFQSKGKNYYALWKARIRKNNGESYSTPQTPQRELYQIDGSDFSSIKTIMTTRIDELLNLDFDQFCKCIILNQGEFARFLSSSFSERKEILEKLYPGEMLDSLSIQLKKEKDEFEKRINEIDIELHTLQGDGPDGEALKSKKESLELDYKQNEGWYTKLESIHYHYISLDSYHSKYHDNSEKINTIRETLKKETSLLNELLQSGHKTTEELSLVRLEVDSKMPRLQELLKAEEVDRLNKIQLSEENLKYTKIENQYHETLAKHQNTLERLDSWAKHILEMEKSFKFPLEELKRSSNNFAMFFELLNQQELLNQEVKSKEERFSQIEQQGLEEGKELKSLEEKTSQIENLRSVLAEMEEIQKTFIISNEQKHRLLFQNEEINQQIKNLELGQFTYIESRNHSIQELARLKEELLPIESTLQVEDLLSAIETCLTHSTLNETNSCPVCQTTLTKETIKNLQNNLKKADIGKLKEKESEMIRLIMSLESSLQAVQEKHDLTEKELVFKNNELNKNLQLIQTLPNLDENPEAKIREAQKELWQQEKYLQDKKRITDSLIKIRESYSLLRTDLAIKKKKQFEIDQKINDLTQSMPFLTERTPESVALLKLEERKLLQFVDLQRSGDTLNHEKAFLDQSLSELRKNLDLSQLLKQELQRKRTEFNEILSHELHGRSASELINELNQKLKEKSDLLQVKGREISNQELKLKDSQSRLYTLEEHIRDIDLQFTKESHLLKEMAKEGHAPFLSDELKILIEGLAQFGLTIQSQKELFSPLKELIESQKLYYKERTSELKMSFASVRARLEDWEKRQDRVTLLRLKSTDLVEKLERKERLYEVLGKDELRTFVLSLVEENLISQTNDELQKLCQGRYEIVHQSRRLKLTPEFYILDKFREGGLRKVSTLSGGETFMVSLAMALGLAEMTRGKAEIDSLFIDEGFGTLDSDSLQDVLDMLKQIQNRGLMVGIISHVKELTQSLPVNLLVSKKQDGISSLEVLHN